MTAPGDVRPPIPATCAHRPTVGGVVAPWVNANLRDGGVDFRAQHNTKAVRCWTEQLCQVCGTDLRRPIVLLCGPTELQRLLFTREPPVHPECAAYTSQACPMVGGRLTHFATRDALVEGQRGTACYDPDCDCGGWVPTPGKAVTERAGGPAHSWYAVYVSGYQLAATADAPDQIAGGVCQPDQVLAVRHVSTPGEGRVWRRVPDPLADYLTPEVAS